MAASQTLHEEIPEFPDLDAEAILACVAEGVSAIPDESAAVRAWVIQTYETVDRLIEQYRRCQEISNDRLQQACMATWTATAIFTANGLRNDLAILTDEATADLFRCHFLHCFDVDPEYVPEYL